MSPPRRVVLTVLLLHQLCGCSWIFQDHLEGGSAAYRGRSEPHCSTGSGWPVVDGLFAALSAVTALAALGDETLPNRGTYLISGIGWTVIHTASLISGSSWAGECRKAYAEWNDDSQASDEQERRRLERELAIHDDEDAKPAVRQPAPPPPSPPPPRGFYCSQSPTAPTAGFCVRDKRACERMRSIASGPVPDLLACALEETAFCFDAGSGTDEDRCAPTDAACAAQQATASASGDCVEAR